MPCQIGLSGPNQIGLLLGLGLWCPNQIGLLLGLGLWGPKQIGLLLGLLGLPGPKQIGLPLGLGLPGPKQIGLLLGLGLPGPRADRAPKSAPLKTDSYLDSDSVRSAPCQDLLQKELDLMRKHSALSLERFRAIESEMKRGAFALANEEDALSKAKRDSSKSLMSLVGRAQAANKSMAGPGSDLVQGFST
jgi:hypothetical protein